MVQGKGVNDMGKGWATENKWNKKVYQTWNNMLSRCYSSKVHNKNPTYQDCSVCSKWLRLSNFVEDFKLIDGYNEDKFLDGQLCLDKDVKSNGENKEYSLENCMWISMSKNTKQSNKTMDYSFSRVKIAQYDKHMNLIKIWDCLMDVQRELGIAYQNISICCGFYEIDCNKEEWYKIHKRNPIKSTGGFIWKYYKENDKK